MGKTKATAKSDKSAKKGNAASKAPKKGARLSDKDLAQVSGGRLGGSHDPQTVPPLRRP
jgi:bacteriocin-like protein